MSKETDTTTSPIRRTSIAANVTLQVLAGLLLLAVVNYLNYKHNWRWDLSRDKDYTLSQQTQNYLKSLRQKTDIVVAFPRGTETEKEVRALVEEYKRTAKSKLNVEYLDLLRENNRRLEMEKKYRVSLNRNGIIVSKEASKAKSSEAPKADAPRNSQFIGEDKIFSFEERPAQPPRIAEFRGENALTSALINVNEKEASIVYVLSDKTELRRVEGGGSGPMTVMNVLYDIAGKQNLEVRPLNLRTVEKIPDDARTVISVWADFDFSEREMELLKNYWDGKRAGLLFLLNPKSQMQRLGGFLTENGVTVRNDRVLFASRTGRGNLVQLEVPAACSPGSAITHDLAGRSFTFIEETQSLALADDPASQKTRNVEVKPLLVAPDDYWGETDYRNTQTLPVPDKEDTTSPNPVILAASVERGALKDSLLKTESGRLVVVGNSTLLDPDTAATPSAYDFGVTALNWTLHRDEMLGIPPKQKGTYRIPLSNEKSMQILWLTVGLLPLAVLMFALFMWSARRQ